MRLMVRSLAIAAGLCALAGTAKAADGLLIVQKMTNGGTPQTNQVQIESRRMRIESGGKQIIMFDGIKQLLTTIDLEKKTYTEMTKDDVERLGAQASDAMAQMQKQLESLPPAQRAQLEAAMARGRSMAGAAGAGTKTEYKRAGTDTVGRWTCDKYEGFRNGRKTSEVCTVEPRALGFSASDFEISKEMSAFFKKMTPQGAEQMFAIGQPEVQGYSGVPVRHSMTIAGRTITTEITEVSRQKFQDSVFQVPAGYEKKAFPTARGRQ